MSSHFKKDKFNLVYTRRLRYNLGLAFSVAPQQRPIPRPDKPATEQMHNRQKEQQKKELFCCNPHVPYEKITLCKKREKVTTSITFGTVSVLMHE